MLTRFSEYLTCFQFIEIVNLRSISKECNECKRTVYKDSKRVKRSNRIIAITYGSTISVRHAQIRSTRFDLHSTASINRWITTYRC